MAFVLGIWMWNRYFAPQVGYAPGTEKVALVKIDRDLRLADAMAGDPMWLRMLAGARSRSDVAQEALVALKKLEASQAMGRPGLQAYVVIQAVENDWPVPVRIEGIDPESDPSLDAPSWWMARRAEQLENDGGSTLWRENYGKSLGTLRARAIGISAFLIGLLVAGVGFLPAAIARLGKGLRKKPTGYATSWSPALGLTVFMIATLAWIGYVGALDLGIEKISSLPVVAALLLDAVARSLPALIAMGFLFKRPSHAFRVLGLDRKPELVTILGVLPVLVLADLLLRQIMGKPGIGEPGGGLSIGDEGMAGLMFAVVSACVVAPVTEEILYRGVLFRSLANRMGVVGGALVSAVVFSSIHFYDLQGFASVAVFGFVCAVLYAATGSLVTVISLHMLYNFCIKIPAWIFYHARLDG